MGGGGHIVRYSIGNLILQRHVSRAVERDTKCLLLDTDKEILFA